MLADPAMYVTTENEETGEYTGPRSAFVMQEYMGSRYRATIHQSSIRADSGNATI